jgi:signal transduction histidine kinase
VVHSTLQPDIRLSKLKIDLGLYPYLACAAFLGSTISLARTFTDLHEFLLFASIKVIAFTTLYFFWNFIAKALKARDRSTLKIWQMMLVGFAGGVFFSLCEDLACWIFSYRMDLDVLPRTLSYGVASTFWFPAASVVSRNLKRYRRLRGEVREQFLQQESVRQARALALAEYQRQIEGQIQESLEVTSKEAARLLTSLQDTDSKRIPEYLRVISSGYFSLMGRDLSQSSYQGISGIAKFRIQISILVKTLYESITTRPLNPLWFSIMVTATILQGLLRNFDLARVAAIEITMFISVYLIQKCQLLCIQYFKVRQIPITIIFTGITILLPLMVIGFLFPLHGQLFRWGAFGLLILVVSVSGHFAQAGLLRFTDFRLESIKELSKVRSSEREVNLLFLQITKDWATFIHGSITSKLESAAIEIENALKEDDFEGVTKSIERVNQYLKSDTTLKRSTEKILLNEVREKVGAWEGVIDIGISSNISKEEVVNVSIRDIGICIEEAILNATRHGDCSSMTIQLIDTESTFRVICSDNGIGFSGTPKGLGTEIFNHATQGAWKLTRDVSTATTVLTLDFSKL